MYRRHTLRRPLATLAIMVLVAGLTLAYLAAHEHRGGNVPGEPAVDVPSEGATATVAGSTAATGTASPADAEAVILAAGDIASCDSSNDELTAEVALETSGTVLTLGDHVYPAGSAERFATCYDPGWGELKERTHPAPGNHDYEVDAGAPYHRYFGAAAGAPGEGWYSFDLGSWHVIALNSNCAVIGGCEVTSAQGLWLATDLASHPADCTLAFWHHPRWSSGQHGNHDMMDAFWRLLAEAGADVVLSGHDHDYASIGAKLGMPPWEIQAPQPAFVALADAGTLRSPVLDVGCGTGENALMLAERGLEVLGVDFAPSAIERARAKANERGLTAGFEVGDARALDRTVRDRRFATAIDSGCFHVFATDDEVARYVASLHAVLEPGAALHLMCFSDAQPGTCGPRRISHAELRAAFADGWRIESIEPTFFITRDDFGGRAHAWLARITRLELHPGS